MLTWSEKSPDQTGWYWYRNGDYITVVEVKYGQFYPEYYFNAHPAKKQEPPMGFYVDGNEFPDWEASGGLWAGPIEKPSW